LTRMVFRTGAMATVSFIWFSSFESMIPKSGCRFSEKIVLKQKS
jgi:hypothetical protein